MYKIPASTLFIGKNLIFVPECHSTNSLAQQLGQQSATPDGTLVITDNQTAGRGQQGNTWISDPGLNFTFSIILKPSFLPAKDQFYLSMAVSLGVFDYVRSLVDVSVRIKWPNDILIDQKKVCGMLIENALQGSLMATSVVGIGLNMNQLKFGNERASSLKAFTGRDYILNDELNALLANLEKRYLQLREQKTEALINAYHQSMYGFGEEKKFKASGLEFKGTITGVDDIGRLKIQIESGEQVFGLKEIEFLY